MRFAFTEQQLELRSAVRRVLERECTADDLRAVAEWSPTAAGTDPRGAAARTGRSSARWAVLSELGAPGLLVPEAHGGLGLDEVDLVGVLEEAGRVALPEALAESAALAAPLLGALGDGPRLERLATGEAPGAVGGFDVTGSGLVATTAPGARGWTWDTPRIAGALRAGILLIALETPGGWELHTLDRRDVAVTATASIDGTRDLGSVAWHPTAAPQRGPGAEALLGAAADRGAVAAAAQLLGLADRMITMAAEYAMVRRQFDRPIGSFQAVKHLLADARVALEFARPATYRAADSLARGVPTRSRDASMAKALASDAADLAARVALQVHGAIGYTWACDLHLYMKRAWALSAAWGSAPTHRARVLADVVAERSGLPRPGTGDDGSAGGDPGGITPGGSPTGGR